MPNPYVIRQTFIVPADTLTQAEQVVAEVHRQSVEKIGGVEVLAQREVSDGLCRGPDAVRRTLKVVESGGPGDG